MTYSISLKVAIFDLPLEDMGVRRLMSMLYSLETISYCAISFHFISYVLQIMAANF